MKTFLRFFAIFLAISWVHSGFFAFAGTEDREIKVVSYYPSPYGKYKELSSTAKTTLAESSGNVGIGTANPTKKLDVAGDTKSKGLILTPQNLAQHPAGEEGLVYFNSNPDFNALYMYRDGAWNKFVQVMTKRLGEKTLAADSPINDSEWRVLGNPGDRLIIQNPVPRRGVYLVEWELLIDVKGNAEVPIRLMYTNPLTGKDRLILRDGPFEDANPNDNAFTLHAVNGNALGMFPYYNQEPGVKLRVEGRRRGSGGQAKIRAGSQLIAELVLIT